MVFTDWQEQSLLITFHDLIAFQGLCAVGCEIGEMYEEETSTLSEDAARVDPDETGTSYFFKASNGDAVVLIIVAKGYSVERI